MQHINLTQQQGSSGHTKPTTTQDGVLNGVTNDSNNLFLGDRNCNGSSSSLGYHSRTSSQSRYSTSSQSVECSAYSSVSSSTSSVSSPTASPRLSPATQGTPASADSSKLDISGASDEGRIMTAKRILLQQRVSPMEYQQKKSLATKTMRGKPVLEALRIPTNVWAGFGFSNSSPSNILKDQLKNEQASQVRQRLFKDADDNGTWDAPNDDVTPVMSFPPNLNCGSGDSDHKTSPLGSSNYLESLASSTVASVTSSESANTKDLTSLLISIGMEKYISLFIEHEIDLKVFLSITDKDLREIGVNALGARRTLLMAVAQQKRLQSPFRGSAAPGAERKGPSTSISSSFSDAW